MAGLKTLVMLLMVSVAVTQAGVFGMGNVMRQRYPNGPEDMYNMEIPVVESRSAGAVPRTQPDSSWMFQRKDYVPVGRKFYYGKN